MIAPHRTQRVLLAVFGGGALFSLGVACLPELATLPPSVDGGKPPPTPATVCGDGVINLGRDGGEECDPGEAGAPLGCSRDCRVVCEPGGVIRDGTEHCYFLAPAADYRAAADECSARGAHVVTLNSEAERAFVYAAFGADAAAPFWVGLDRSVEEDTYLSARKFVEPGWEPGCGGCFVHPPDAGAIEGDAGSCVSDAPDAASFKKLGCQTRASVVCEREPLGASIDFFSKSVVVPKTHENKRYVYFPSPSTAAEARDACKALGGSLALFESEDEREQVFAAVQSALQEPSEKGTWIGLAREGDASAFTWDDGVPESARPSIWGSKQPASAPPGDVRAAVFVSLLGSPGIDVDTQLARALPVTESHTYLCQL